MKVKEVWDILSLFDEEADVLIPYIEEDGRMVHKPFNDIVEDANGNALII